MSATTIITGPILQKICPNLPATIAAQIADTLESVTPGYRMHDADILQEFIAEIACESAGFRMRLESLNYSANRLLQVWPSRFKTLKASLPYVNNPISLGNKVYGGRMGNKLPNDGYDFRGSGYGMITGRSMAEAYAAWWSFNDVVDLMNRCRNEIWWATDSACWMFAVDKKLIPAAIDDDLIAITKSINGGLIGLKTREFYYNSCLRNII